ncbi:S9 family peptidase [Mycobacterium spongiae]|uniref:Prolyl oligopeptidase family serine peptidase n=1 Tax=Mycobacterium spongiae TaxID=886343 RepID=A0A975PV57_9MYCO|nr:S9 family peptidase [Mycobacterium spongiae]QUR65755.1 prolyl oligopeptidase family serine peptidase [Mycobacterium spongiae]
MATYGSWPTPITSELVVRAAAGLGGVSLHGDTVIWSELRPEEGGRTQLVRRTGDEPPVDLLPKDRNARTAVHEYGGGAWWVAGETVYFVDWADQRLYAVTGDSPPVPVTPEPKVPRGDRWANGCVASGGRWVLVVREHHPSGSGPAEVVNEIVVLDGTGEVAPRTLVTGPDFVSDPRVSPDGSRLCWLQWSHPDMPWDGTELCVADVQWADIGPTLADPRVIAGRPDAGPGGAGAGESVSAPRWAEDGSLWFISDRSDWWNLYRWDPGTDGVTCTVAVDAEIGLPQWVFGQSRFAFLSGGRTVFAFSRAGIDYLAMRLSDGRVVDLDVPYTSFASIQADGDRVVFVGASATVEPAVVSVRVETTGAVTATEILRPPRDLGLDVRLFSRPESISFPSSEGRTAHALFYPPTNPDVTAETGELPPLLVLIHGGPTSAARPMLQLGTQYWTSRGFAVVDVNYGGSTGYGRAYRNQLRHQWGIVDLDDCEAAARWLAEQQRVDPARLCIRGGSAGGYTTLAALAFRNTFAAGASHFGVADLEALATETHKFESRYLDGLIGHYPARRDLYLERSPIHHIDGFDRPLIVLQGLEDEIVPPNQAEMIVEALRAKGIPVAYVAFEGEQHGFRQAVNIRRALDAELSFYAQVFGFTLPAGERIDLVPVENL